MIFTCLHSFARKNKRDSHEKVCKNKDSCIIIMPSKDTKILEFNQNQKSDKVLSIICADLECLKEKIDGFKNSPQHSFKAKLNEPIPSDFSMSTISS